MNEDLSEQRSKRPDLSLGSPVAVFFVKGTLQNKDVSPASHARTCALLA